MERRAFDKMLNYQCLYHFNYALSYCCVGERNHIEGRIFFWKKTNVLSVQKAIFDDPASQKLYYEFNLSRDPSVRKKADLDLEKDELKREIEKSCVDWRRKYKKQLERDETGNKLWNGMTEAAKMKNFKFRDELDEESLEDTEKSENEVSSDGDQNGEEKKAEENNSQKKKVDLKNMAKFFEAPKMTGFANGELERPKSPRIRIDLKKKPQSFNVFQEQSAADGKVEKSKDANQKSKFAKKRKREESKNIPKENPTLKKVKLQAPVPDRPRFNQYF